MRTTTKLELRPISQLIPYANNARTHSQEQIDRLRRSLREFGFVAPVLIDGAGNILAGHGRVLAAQAEGIEAAPCVLVEHLTAEQQRAYILADNRLAEDAGWDQALVASELAALAGAGFDVALTGFDPAGISLGDAGDDPQPNAVCPTAVEDDCEISIPEDPVVKAGQVWQLGQHRLMCGNSGSAADMARLMGGSFARLCVTSPPYGVGKEYETAGLAAWEETVYPVIDQLTRYCRIICWNIGDLYATGSQFIEPTSMYSTTKMRECGFGLMYSRIWKKPGANFNGVNPYHLVSMKPVQEYEWILAYGKSDIYEDFYPLQETLAKEAKKAKLNDNVIGAIAGVNHMFSHWFSKHQWTMIDQKNYELIQQYCAQNHIDAFLAPYSELRREYDDLQIYQKTLTDDERNEFGQWAIWEMPTVSRRDGHPAAFPVELPSRLIRMHSRQGDIVVEPFCGSGTTMIACEQLGRRCYAMEIDPRYCDVIIKRWEKFTGQKAVLIDG